MLNMINLLAGPVAVDALYPLYMALCITLLVRVFVAALFAIIVVLMQPGNSTGINALGGSSETFFGKNKGKSIEERLKKITYGCLIALAVIAVIFFILQYDGIWS